MSNMPSAGSPSFAVPRLLRAACAAPFLALTLVATAPPVVNAETGAAAPAPAAAPAQTDAARAEARKAKVAERRAAREKRRAERKAKAEARAARKAADPGGQKSGTETSRSFKFTREGGREVTPTTPPAP